MTTRRATLLRGAAVAVAIAAVPTLALAPYAGAALVVSAPVESPDFIVSLASHEWERLPVTVAQATKYPRAVVLLTVPRQVTEYNCHDCADRDEWLVKAGVSRSRIRELHLWAPGTYGEAVAVKHFLHDRPPARLLVVTSPYHTRRSLATFERLFAGTKVTVGVLPATATSPARPERWWAASYDRAYVRYEWAAVLYYRLKYGVPVSLAADMPESPRAE